MSDKKEVYFIGVGLVAAAFFQIFYDLFEYYLTPVFPDNQAFPFIKTLSGVLAILGGLIILKYYSKYPKKSEDKST